MTQKTENEAAAWLLRPPAERQASAAFLRWIAVPGNRAVFEQMSLLFADMDDADLQAIPLPPARRISRRGMLAGGGALLAAGIAGGVTIGTQWNMLHAGHGEQLTARIPGGTILLDVGSRLKRPEHAPLQLVSGRAEVQSDRPVTFRQPGCRVHLQGRAALHRAGAGGAASVIDGECRMELDQGGTLQLTSGREAVIIPGEAAHLGDIDMDEITGWTRGRAVFDDRPLWLVTEDLNRYRAGHVQLRGNIGRRRVSGSYPISDPDQGLDGLVAGLSLTRHDITPWLVLLSA